MDNDKELLELAAKAASMNCRMRYCEAWKGMALYTPQDGYFGPTWNPLSNDADALQLSASLKIDIVFSDGNEVCAGSGTYHADSDRCAATRRAITRAAAAIGRNA